jgi:hypothetical protein
MAGWPDACLIAAFTVGLAAMGAGEKPALADDQALTRQGPACGGDEIARGTVGKILDGCTLALDDGREVRLAAIEVPGPRDPAARPGEQDAPRRWPLEPLPPGIRSCCGGRRADPIATAASSPTPMRYGTVKNCCCSENSWPRDLPGSAPASRVRAPGTCWTGKRRPARPKLGLWADPYYEVLNAETPKDALAYRGRFALVEGKVASVRESGPRIYVNFGRRRTGDITVTILKRNERNFAAAGLDLRGLAGRRIRVRGWIEARSGERAWIEAERPEQIEMAD